MSNPYTYEPAYGKYQVYLNGEKEFSLKASPNDVHSIVRELNMAYSRGEADGKISAYQEVSSRLTEELKQIDDKRYKEDE